MCIKVDDDDALRAANRCRVEDPALPAASEWTQERMQQTLLLGQRLEDVARASGDWAWETDAQHRYTWVHGAGVGIRPPAVGELIPAGRVVNWLGEPELPLRDFHAVLDQGEPIVRLLTEELHQGQVRYVSRSAVALLHPDGSLRGHRGSARDVTKSLEAKVELWRRDEALRIAKEQAEASNHAKSVLVSKVGHELRTPLNAIVGLAQLIQQQGGPADTASVERWSDQIAKTGWHMADVLDMLLELGRMGAVNASIATAPVDLVEVIGDAMSIVEGDARARFIHIAFDDRVQARAMGDRRALRQVLVNLLTNAIKYNCDGGWIRLQVQGGKAPRIDVQDTGPGLNADQVGRLYRPFERLGAERSAVQGHGLGLMMCKELVTSMGGTIEVQSTVGQGTTFSVLLPAVCKSMAGGFDRLGDEADRPTRPQRLQPSNEKRA